jgi:hypothetical protein
MTHPNSEQPLIRLPCYEPAGHCVELAESDLVQHILLIGSTGSGKSTLLTSAIGQLILHEAHSPQNKVGLLVLDAKADDLVARVRQAAQLGGRAPDVVVLGPNGDYGFDLFGGLNSLADVDRTTRQVMLGTDRFGSENAFWWQSCSSMLNAAFALLLASGQPITFTSTVEFLRRWFLSPETPPSVTELVHRLNLQGGSQNPLLATALDQVHLWSTLDSRTKSNLQTCLLNVLRPLLSPAAARCFNPQGRASFDPAQIVETGRLCVVSINSLTDPDLARFLFRLVNQAFFDAVQHRRQTGRLGVLVADEFPLVLTLEFVDQLGTLRSKRGAVIAATQGLHSLSERIGTGQARALLTNFNTNIYMRTREAEAAVQAFVALGNRKEIKRRPKDEPGLFGLMHMPASEPQATEVPICPVGALGQLAQHQAFIIYADGRRTTEPVWFVPWFEMTEPATEVAPVGDVDLFFTAAHVETLMRQAGCKRLWSGEVVLAAAKLGRRRNRKSLLKKVQTFFLTQAAMVPEGLDTLPSPWLAALTEILWKTRKPEWTKLPYFVDRVGVQNGVLLLHFAQEQPNPDGRFTSWDRLRLKVNAGLYPSAWRPLNRLHVAKLRPGFPELRVTLNASNPEIT